ncbi:hypothetical protein LXA43DRAFT_1155822 [Ganoderma leucocontextum]|nr:hypothetical protein LXA43DRAFT_1155822 [Ganoderma leucocontextum]
MSSVTLSIFQDSGPPAGSTDYTTVVLLHGFAWHSGIFVKLVPLAAAHNARIVLVNRRDYPGATPFSSEERTILESAAKGATTSDASAAHAQLEAFMRERAREVYDTLASFVHGNNIPLSQREENKGGIVLAGWSFGTAWMTAFLAHAPSFSAPNSDIELGKYMRRVVFYDNPYLVLGFPPPPDPYNYNPLFDPAIPPGDQTRVFSNWVSGYFAHRTGTLALAPSSSSSLDEEKQRAASAFEVRTYLAAPPPTLSTLTPEEAASALFPSPGDPGGSDSLLVTGGITSGVFATLREAALAVPRDARWRAVEVRHVWCDRSVWEATWTAWNLRWLFAEAKRSGAPLREITSVHWDEPERALVAFLTDAVQTY